jgi:uncharacterized protein YkwD
VHIYRSLRKNFLLIPLIIFLFLASPCLPLVPECRAEEPSNLLDAAASGADRSLEKELLALVNRQRIQQGLQALTLDDALTGIAREHSHGMIRQGFISHDRPSGSLKARMAKAGYLYEVVRENVASAQTVAKAHTALLKSPTHKNNILARDVTRIGIGIIPCRQTCCRQIYITEVFADPRDEYEPAMVQTMLENRINELRQNGGGSFQSNSALEKMASRSLQSLDIHYKKEDLKNLAAVSAYELREDDRAQLSRVEIDVQLVRNPENLSIPVLKRDGQAHMYGSAVRKITDSQNQTAFLVLALIGITR